MPAVVMPVTDCSYLAQMGVDQQWQDGVTLPRVAYLACSWPTPCCLSVAAATAVVASVMHIGCKNTRVMTTDACLVGPHSAELFTLLPPTPIPQICLHHTCSKAVLELYSKEHQQHAYHACWYMPLQCCAAMHRPRYDCATATGRKPCA